MPTRCAPRPTPKRASRNLSGERIAKEMLRLLEAHNPVPVLRMMAASGILSRASAGRAADCRGWNIWC